MEAVSPFVSSAMVAVRLLAATPASGPMATVSPPLASLEVRRAPEAAGCPDADGLAADLADITDAPDRFVARPGAPVRVAVDWDRLPNEGFRASVRLDGARQGIRTLTDAGPTCAALGHAVAIALALVLDADTPGAGAAREATAAAEPGSPSPRTSEAASGPGAPSAAGTTGHLALLAGPSWGQVAHLSGVGRLELGARLRRASVMAGAERVIARRSAIAPGTVEVSLWAGRLSLCGLLTDPDPSRWLQLDVCAIGSVGALHGQGEGFAVSSVSTLTWWAAGGEIRAQAVFRRRWLVALVADVAATLYRYTFSVAAVGAVPGSDRWTGQLLAGVGVKLW